MRRCFLDLWCSIAAAFLALFGGNAVASKVTITVEGVRSADVSKLNVTTLRWDQDQRRFEATDDAWKADKPGTWNADLSPGRYQLELTGTVGKVVVFCRSPQMLINHNPTTWPVTLQNIRVLFVHHGEPLELRHLAIRSFGLTGETIVHDGEPIRSARLLTTTETRLDVTLIGEDADTLALGHALIMPTPPQLEEEDGDGLELVATVTAAGRHWYQRPVVLSRDNPPIKAATLTLVHPGGELVVPYREGVEVVTNRPLFHLGYRLEAESGRVLVSRKCFVLVDRIKRFVLGGKLQPSAFAKILTRLPSKKEYRVEGLLNDPSGIEIDVRSSKIDWSETFTLRGGGSLPKNPLDAVELGVLADPLDTVRVGVKWEWASKREQELTPEDFIPFRSPHFQLHAPPAWRDRAEVYLAQLEFCYAILTRTTGRKGPQRINVRWRLNTHNAQARVGGKTSWMSMPLNGLYGATDPFGRPWFMVHEMLHTFGYNHGKPMTEQVKIGNYELGLTRWEIPWRLYNAKDVEVTLEPLARK